MDCSEISVYMILKGIPFDKPLSVAACSFQSLLQGAEVQPTALQNDGSNQEVDSLYLSACNAVLDSAQRELESAAQRQIQMLSLEVR
jgi:hypothetical protein